MSDLTAEYIRLGAENERLRAENEKLRAENKEMREKVVSDEMDLTAVSYAGFARGKNYARAEIERQKVQIDNLTAENEKLRAAGCRERTESPRDEA